MLTPNMSKSGHTIAGQNKVKHYGSKSGQTIAGQNQVTPLQVIRGQILINHA